MQDSVIPAYCKITTLASTQKHLSKLRTMSSPNYWNNFLQII